MDELYIGDFVAKASVDELRRLLGCLDSGAPAGAQDELLAALRADPDNLGEYFRLVADMKIGAAG